MDFPWPIIQFARGENTEAFKLWPLFTYRKVEQREKMSLFWPIFIQEKEENEDRDEVLNRFLYISKFHQVYYQKGKPLGKAYQVLALLPLCRGWKGDGAFLFPGPDAG